MARFVKGDKIEYVRTTGSNHRVVEVLQKGIVTDGPWELEKIDHYKVDWNWTNDGIEWKNFKNDLICDYPSTKYRYRLI
jgi:hypothetical protein